MNKEDERIIELLERCGRNNSEGNLNRLQKAIEQSYEKPSKRKRKKVE